MQPKVIVLMGVSGSGKTTIGRALASRLEWHFYDGDDYHPQVNVEKMAAGIPLSDADRAPWLDKLRDLITFTIEKRQQAVLACSALKRSYRQRLIGDNPQVVLVFLRGDYELIQKRLQARQGHYMKADMLHSQFDILQEPPEAVVVDVQMDVPSTVERIVQVLGLGAAEG